MVYSVPYSHHENPAHHLPVLTLLEDKYEEEEKHHPHGQDTSKNALTVFFPEYVAKYGMHICDDVWDFKRWFDRYAKTMHLPRDLNMSRQEFVHAVRKTRVGMFGKISVRGGGTRTVPVYATYVGENSASQNLAFISLKGPSAEVLEIVNHALCGSIGESLRSVKCTPIPAHFDVACVRPTRTLHLSRAAWEVLEFQQLVPGVDAAGCPFEKMDRVFENELFALWRKEASAHTTIRICETRNMVLVNSDDMSALLRTILRIKDFFKEKSKWLNNNNNNNIKPKKSNIRNNNSTACCSSTPTSSRFVDTNNPYTVLAKYGHGVKYHH